MTKNMFLEEHSVSQLLPMNKYCGYQPTAAASVTNAIPEHHATFFRWLYHAFGLYKKYCSVRDVATRKKFFKKNVYIS